MNSFSVSDVEVIPYSQKNPEVALFIGENDHGKYGCFRVMERVYKKPPRYWIVTVNQPILQKVEAMNLKIGDFLNLHGELDQYNDITTKKRGSRILLWAIDYCKVPSSQESTNQDENDANESIDTKIARNQDEIFVSGIKLS